MIARQIEVTIKPETYNEFKNVLENEIVPILQRQPGFLGTLSLVHETTNARTMSISMWKSKPDAENYNKKEYPRILELLKPYLHDTPRIEYFKVEFTTLRTEHSVAA